jgi:hypothetical protein
MFSTSIDETPFLLSNKDIICTHGKLDPRKSTDMKCIRNVISCQLFCYYEY